MAIFQVSSRTVQPPGPPKKRPRRVHQRWYAVLRRLVVGGLIIAALAALLGKLGLSSLFFILLPVCVSIIMARSYLYNRNMFLLTTGLALIYFGAVTGWELLTHRPGTSEIIVVTTTLALAVLFEPARARVQSFMEQRFHLRDDETVKAVEAFNSTLREEIDLDQLRERLFAVVQETMQPQSVSVWVRKTVQNDRGSALAPAGWREKGSQAQREEYQREMQPVQEPVNAPVDHEGRPYISAASSEACRGDPRGRPDHSQVLQAVQDPVGGRFPPIMHFEVNVADNDPLLFFALSHPGDGEVERLQLASPGFLNLQANGGV